jgi:hypothetical protein
MDGLKGPYDFDVEQDTPDGLEKILQKCHKLNFT